jgi:hypothetical protein
MKAELVKGPPVGRRRLSQSGQRLNFPKVESLLIIAFPNHFHQTNYPKHFLPGGLLTSGKQGGSMSTLTEADTRAKLIDPAIHARGWLEDFIRREETAGSIEIVAGKARRRSRGRMDYILRVRVNPATQPVAVALLEAKKESQPPGQGLDQAKGYARASQHNVQFVFSSNGHLFVEFDRSTGLTSAPRSLRGRLKR